MSFDRIEERTVTSGVGVHDGRGSSTRSRGRRVGSVVVKVIALVLVVGAAVWAYRANKSAPTMDMNTRIAAGSLPFPVVFGEAERGRVTGAVVYTGSVAPFNEEDVYPRVTGRIVEMAVYPGDAVRPGQVVARLDTVELASKVRESDAMLASAEANRAQMDADLIAAQQEVVHMEKELVQADAEATYWRSVIARTERLFASGAVSRQDYENDRSMAVSYEAKREAARAKLDQVRAMETAARKKIEAANAMVAQGRATAQTARIVRDYANITASSGGYVVKRLVAPGVLVQPGMAILKIAQIDRVRLQANVGEKDVASIRVGSPVTVTLAGGTQAPRTARVTSVFPFVDQGARTAVVEAVVDNRDRKLLPGQYVMMQFTTGDRPDAVTVPSSAVARLGPKSTVWVVKGDQVEPRTVTTGLESAERMEIVTGLQSGERIVVRGHEPLYAGARVADASAPAQPSGHAGHGAGPTPPPAAPAQPSGHAGHGASVTAAPAPPAVTAPDAADPHRGMKMPAAEQADPHKGMNMPSTPKESPHAGH